MSAIIHANTLISNLLSADSLGQPPVYIPAFSLSAVCGPHVCGCVLFDMDVLPYLLGLGSSVWLKKKSKYISYTRRRNCEWIWMTVLSTVMNLSRSQRLIKRFRLQDKLQSHLFTLSEFKSKKNCRVWKTFIYNIFIVMILISNVIFSKTYTNKKVKPYFHLPFSHL